MVNRELIFTFGYSDWVFATSLEIMTSRLDLGATLGWIDWSGKLQKSRKYPIADRVHFLESKIRFRFSNLLDEISELGDSNQFYYSTSVPKYASSFSEKEELAQEVAYLELISVLRESAPIASMHSVVLSDFKLTFLNTYNAAISLLQTERPNTVFIYNGRFLQERAVWEACKELSIQVIFFEKFNPNWQQSFFLFTEPTHSPSYRSAVMQSFGEKFHAIDSDKHFFVGEHWFVNRRLGRTQNHTKNQSLSSSLDLERPFFVYFHSSEDELLTTELVSVAWGDQMKALTTLLEVMTEVRGIDLVIRMHPNLLFKSKREIKIWTDFGETVSKKFPFVHFVSASSAISSYKLMEQSAGVVTVGSTIGVEAAFFERKSILIGRAFHEFMGITQNPSSKEELAELLLTGLTPQELEKAKHNALNYAVFQSQGGLRFNRVRCLIRRRRLVYYFGNFRISRNLGISILMRMDIVFKNFGHSLRQRYSNLM